MRFLINQLINQINKSNTGRMKAEFLVFVVYYAAKNCTINGDVQESANKYVGN